MQSDGKSDRQQSLSTPFQLHGVLVRILNKGVLLLGEPGIGKSECALDVVRLGHQLVADDVVEVFEKDGRIVGRAPQLTRCLIEIRGLGIIDIRDAFGDDSVCDEVDIALCVELVAWNDDVDRLGQEQLEHEIDNHRIPKFVLPVGPSRNLATLVETAVRLNGARSIDILLDAHDALLDPIR
jgi:HPr kinase/phosphorylase